jgi:DNA-binding XRE family transcriptional regulator
MNSEVEKNQAFMSRRKELKISQRKLGEALGLDRNAISSWETGVHQPRLFPWQTAKLCEMLQLSVDELARMFPKVEQPTDQGGG